MSRPATSPSSELVIRVADPARDAAAIASVYAPYIESHFTSFEQAPPDAATMARRMAETLERYPWLVATHQDRVLGYAYASSHRARWAYQWCVDTAIYLREDAVGRGVGRALYEALLPILRRQDYVNAYAGIALPNPASVALHERLGFTLIGIYDGTGYKHGQWRDVGWWQLLLQPRAEQPPDPIPFPRLDQPLR